MVDVVLLVNAKDDVSFLESDRQSHEKCNWIRVSSVVAPIYHVEHKSDGRQ